MAQTFVPIEKVYLEPETSAAWEDVDVSPYVPEGATGVILHCWNWSSYDEAIGLRKNGSTDDRHEDVGPYDHFWAMVGIDSNRIFEIWLYETSYTDFRLIGYTKSGVTFFTNAHDKSLGSSGDWYDIDCSSEAPDAVGLIFEVLGYNVPKQFGIRKNGSTDNRYKDIEYHNCFDAVIGCDGSQVCEGKVEYHPTMYFFLVGYITDGAIFNTNATDVSLSTTLQWLDLSALPSGANFGIIEVDDGEHDFGLRKNGSAENIFYHVSDHSWGIVECDEDGIIEGFIGDTAVDFFVVGYSTKSPPTYKPGSNMAAKMIAGGFI